MLPTSDPQLRRELQIRARVESIFNKGEDDFATRQEYDDYLEEREDIIFNLGEGIDVEEMEAKVAAYQRDNMDSIVANEARRVEQQRQAAALAGSGDPAGVSGTAAAFDQGRDPEPHQGMEYTAAIPTAAVGLATGAAPIPLAGAPATGDIQHGGGQLSDDAWQRMALASGWTPDMPRRRAFQEAFGSLLVF